MNKVRSLPDFIDSFQDKSSKEKMIFVIVDQSPDENQSYTNTIKCATDHFNEHDFDAHFVATNAPGRGAFNQVKRRMPGFNKKLSGVILPHDHFGTNLDNNNNTVHEELDLKILNILVKF